MTVQEAVAGIDSVIDLFFQHGQVACTPAQHHVLREAFDVIKAALPKETDGPAV